RPRHTYIYGATQLALDLDGILVHRLDVAHPSPPRLDVAQQLHQPVRAFAARCALAAGLVGVELGPAGDGPDDAGRLVEALQGLGAEHGTGGAYALVAKGYVEVLVGEHWSRRAARRPE